MLATRPQPKPPSREHRRARGRARAHVSQELLGLARSGALPATGVRRDRRRSLDEPRQHHSPRAEGARGGRPAATAADPLRLGAPPGPGRARAATAPHPAGEARRHEPGLLRATLGTTRRSRDRLFAPRDGGSAHVQLPPHPRRRGLRGRRPARRGDPVRVCRREHAARLRHADRSADGHGAAARDRHRRPLIGDRRRSVDTLRRARPDAAAGVPRAHGGRHGRRRPAATR